MTDRSDESLDASPIKKTSSFHTLISRDILLCACHAEGFATYEHIIGTVGDESIFVSVEGAFERQADGSFKCGRCGDLTEAASNNAARYDDCR